MSGRGGRPAAVLVFTSSLLAGVIGCEDPDRFSTSSGESYCGTVTAASFVRTGMEVGTPMRLQLDTRHLQDKPGLLWTGPFQSGERLAAAPLSVLPELVHDPLSQLVFGEGRLRNVLATVTPTSTNENLGAIVAVISLLQSDDVEVRLFRGESATTAEAPKAALFGVFLLNRTSGDCGLP